MATREQLHELIDQLPEEALLEIGEAIRRAIMFYDTPYTPTETTEPIILKGRMLPMTIRPDFEPDLEDTD